MAALALCLAACSAPPVPRRALAPGQPPPGPAVGLGARTDIARGTLTYAVAFAGEHTLVTVELRTRFALLVRDMAPDRAPRARHRVRHRIDLGPADFDIGALTVDPTRDLAWIASRDGTVRAYDLQRGTLTTTWHLGSSASAVAVSPDGRYLATGTEDGVLCLRRSRDGALLQCVLAHQAPISDLAFGHVLASSAWDGTVVVWELPSLAVRARRRFAGSANALAFAPDGARLAVARSREPPRRSPAALARERAGHPDPAHPHDAVSIWNIATGATTVLAGHRGPVTAVAWASGGARLVSGAWDRAVHLWDPRAGALLARHRGFTGLVRDLAVAPRGASVAVGAWTHDLQGPASALIALLYAHTAGAGD